MVQTGLTGAQQKALYSAFFQPAIAKYGKIKTAAN
jgi:hypothetical protein